MKKLFAVTIILGIILFTACTPAFAEELSAGSYTTSKGTTLGENTDNLFTRLIRSDRALDELPPDRVELTDEEKLRLAQEYIAQYKGAEDPENSYTVLCFKTLSNGMSLIFVEPKHWEYFAIVALEPLGKYAYFHGGGRTVKLYQNGVYTEIFDAYNSGMIDDAIIEEINDVMHFDRLAEQTSTTQPEETTKPDETNQPDKTKQPDETKPATRDSATPDSVYNSGSSVNGAIATGENNISLVIIIAVALATAAGIGFAAFRRKL